MPARRQAPARRRLNRDRVLRAALKLADKEGIDALSMRKLAQHLGVEAMSLYNHVGGKDDIVDGILDLVAAEVDPVRTGADWKVAVREYALSSHRVLMAHQWAASRWMSTRAPSQRSLREADAVLRVLREGGFSEDMTYHAFHVLQSHVIGFTLYLLSLPFDRHDLQALAGRFLAEFPMEEYPYLAEHIRQHMEPTEERQGTFEFGLELVLEGLERLRTDG